MWRRLVDRGCHLMSGSGCGDAEGGSSISEISRTVGSAPGSVFSILLLLGGITDHRRNTAPVRWRWLSVKRFHEV